MSENQYLNLGRECSKKWSEVVLKTNLIVWAYGLRFKVLFQDYTSKLYSSSSFFSNEILLCPFVDLGFQMCCGLPLHFGFDFLCFLISRSLSELPRVWLIILLISSGCGCEHESKSVISLRLTRHNTRWNSNLPWFSYRLYTFHKFTIYKNK